MNTAFTFDHIIQELGIREVRRYLTEDGDIRYSEEMVEELNQLINHPGWHHVMNFATQYTLREMANLVDSTTDPESAVAMNPDAGLTAPLDGVQWAGKMARQGGFIQGMRFICNIPNMIKESIHERAAEN